MRDDDPKNWVGRTRPGLGSGTLTKDQRDAKFAEYVERTADADGWWLDPAKVSAMAETLGLPAGTAVDDVRKALFLKRYPA